MIISQIILKNWRNFYSVDIKLWERVFLVGANASGKSNFLDVFRFIRDIVKSGIKGIIFTCGNRC
ncbi:AAA family ATPase [Candidatus Poribacteria bacterium]|nr:AAA family ATPase [Candidatus Poribacteria bacterium]